MNEFKKKVIIDCDPGIDDALALITAIKSEKLDILGITTVCGNVESMQGAKNALRVLKILNRLDIPVYIGENIPLKRELVTAQDTHGEDGLGEISMDYLDESLIKKGGVDFIIETLKSNNKDEVSIIALGPFVNMYKAIKKDTTTFHKVKEVVSMGGTFKSHGNCSPVAEFNYWVDPDSIKGFLNIYQNPFTMVGLDVTRKIVLTPNLREMIKQFNTQLGNFIYDITQFYVDFHWMQERTLGCVINDPLAVEYFIDKTLCDGFNAYVDISCSDITLGQSVVDCADFYQKRKNVFVLTSVDEKKFMSIFLNRIFPNSKTDIANVLNL